MTDSKKTLARVNRASRDRPCAKCGAKIGEACKTAGGNPTDTPHLYRLRYALARIRREGKA